jgi:hypothetical protein
MEEVAEGEGASGTAEAEAEGEGDTGVMEGAQAINPNRRSKAWSKKNNRDILELRSGLEG